MLLFRNTVRFGFDINFDFKKKKTVKIFKLQKHFLLGCVIINLLIVNTFALLNLTVLFL